jgi:hypothetical protein
MCRVPIGHNQSQPPFQWHNSKQQQGKGFPYPFNSPIQPSNQFQSTKWRPHQQQPTLMCPPQLPMQGPA